MRREGQRKGKERVRGVDIDKGVGLAWRVYIVKQERQRQKKQH